MVGRQAPLQPVDVDYAAVDVDLVQLQPAGFRNSLAVTERERHQAAVARLVASAFGRPHQLVHLAPGKVLTVAPVTCPAPRLPRFPSVPHFVESSPFRNRPNPAPNGGLAFSNSSIDKM